MKYYITGIAGLIGSNLAKALLQKGYIVGGCDNLIGGYEDNIPSKNVKWDNIDILNNEALQKAMQGYDVVIHAAALAYEGLSVFSPKLVSENIYCGTTSVASAAIANNIKFFLNCSSMARYGNNIPPFTEDMEVKPVDPYGLAKVQAEQMLKMLYEIHGLKYLTVVPHNVVGPGQVYTDPYRNVAAIFTNRVLLGRPIIIYGDGLQKRSLSPVKTCIDAMLKIIENYSEFQVGDVFNIGPDGNELSIKEIAFMVGHYCQVYPSIIHYPDRPREVKNAWCSSDKAMTILNYNPNIQPTEKTVEDIVRFVKTRGPKPFNYTMPIEIIKDNTPTTWTKKEM